MHRKYVWMKLHNQKNQKLTLQTQNQLDGDEDIELNTDHYVEFKLNIVITNLYIEILGNLKCPRTNYTF